MQNVTTITTLQKKIEQFSLIVAPILFGASTFFWVNAEYSVTSATLIILSMFFWLPAFAALFNLMKTSMPRYAVWGLWVSYFGCISGVCFAFLGYITTILNVPHEQYLEALNNYPLSSQLLLFASGPLFPLSILLIGIQMIRKRVVPISVAILLCIAGIAFPVSRILRIEWAAHIADIILLIPCVIISIKELKKS